MTPMIDVVFLLLVFFVCASVGQLPDFLLPAKLAPGVTAPVDIPPALEIPEHAQIRIVLRPGKTVGSISFQLNEQVVPTAAELRSALLAVTFEGRDAGDIYRALRERDIVVKALPATMVVTDGLQPRSYNALRFSTHIYNSEAELDQLTEALAQLTR